MKGNCAGFEPPFFCLQGLCHFILLYFFSVLCFFQILATCFGVKNARSILLLSAVTSLSRRQQSSSSRGVHPPAWIWCARRGMSPYGNSSCRKGLITTRRTNSCAWLLVALPWQKCHRPPQACAVSGWRSGQLEAVHLMALRPVRPRRPGQIWEELKARRRA